MLYNVSRKKKIIGKVRFADSSFKRFRGLMFSKKKDFDYALIFDMGKGIGCGLISDEGKLKASIHMCFVFFPIDVLFLDREKKVVDIAFALKPWTLDYTPKENARYVIELPCGNAKKVKIGNKVIWK